MRTQKLLAAVGLLVGMFNLACGRTREPQAPAAVEKAPVATGRIRGVVKLRGNPPPVRSEQTGKDTGVCGTTVPVTRLALGNDNGVKQTFVYLDGVESTAEARPAATLTVEQKGCEYGPHAMTVAAGSQIEIVNGDPILHNVHAKQMAEDGPQTIFNIAQPIRGQRTKIDPHMKPGIVALTCEAGHPWMTAYILVANHPYVAVTGENGGFVINDVPAGTYPIKMWHEGVTLKRVIASLQLFEYEDPYELTEQVIVPPGGEAQINFDLQLR